MAYRRLDVETSHVERADRALTVYLPLIELDVSESRCDEVGWCDRQQYTLSQVFRREFA